MSTAPTLTSASSFNLSSGTLASSFYNATLTGSSQYAKAHTLNPATPSGITGDTIVTTASRDTIFGGTNYDFLVAGGSLNLVTTQTISGGHDTLVSANNNNTLIGNSAATFELTNSAYLANNSLKGTGSNGLLITSDATINDNFSSLSGIGALSLSGVSSVSLGAAAQTDGLKAVYAGNGNTYVRQLGNDNLATTLVGGTGNDSFDLNSGSQFIADSIVGGSGIDSLKVLSSATLSDANFSRIQSEEVLTLWKNSQATLGANAGSAGFSTIFGVNGPLTLNAAGETLRGLTYNLSANTGGGDSIVGTSLGDNFIVSGANIALETFNGGAGNDTLTLSKAATLSDSFVNKTSIEVLSLSGASAVSLGAAAQTAGIKTVNAGNGNTYVRQLGNDNLATTLVGGTGNDSFDLNSGSQFIADSIVGGSGIDSLKVLSSATLSDANFSRIQSEEVLTLWKNSQATLGANAGSAGFSTIFGVNGPLTLNAASETLRGLTYNLSANTGGGDSIVGTSLGDSFIVNGANFTLETLNGGAGKDTLSIRNAVTLNDSFQSDTGIEALSVTSPSQITLGGNAALAGINSLYGGAGSDSFTQLASDTLATTFIGGAGNDLFSIANSSSLAVDSIAGGAGIADTLSIAAPATINDSFTRVSGVEALSLTGSSKVTLGGNAQAAGIASVFGGNSSTTIDASGYTTGVTLNASANTLTGNLLIGSQTAPTDFIVNGNSNFSLNKVYGGDGTDTLSVATSLTTNDQFRNVHDVEVVSLGAASNVQLGSNAAAAGISEVIGSAGNDTLVQTSSNTEDLTLAGGAGNDSISVYSTDELANDSISGGSGVNTLRVGSSAYLADNAFTNVSGIQALQLTSQSAVTLGSNAENAGIASVFGGAGSDTFTQLNTAPTVTLVGGGDSDLFKVQSGSLLSGDSIIGGLGTDTLAITSSDQTISNFNSVTGIEALSLSGGNNVVDLTSSTFTAVTAGSGNDSFAVSGSSKYASSFGSASINGGAGTDTVSITNSGYIGSGISLEDIAFGALKNIELVNLNTSASGSYVDANIDVTLGSQALASGVQSLIGSASAKYEHVHVTETAQFNRGIALTLSGYYDYLHLENGAQFASDTISMTGSGYVTFNQPTALSDNDFVNKSGTNSIYFNTSNAGASSVELGTYASQSGAYYVDGGKGDMRVTVDGAYGPNGVFFNGGTGNDYFQVSSLSQVDKFYGGGQDTLAFSSNSETLSNFNNVHNVEVLSLTGGNNVVNLTGGEGGSQFTSVIGGTGNDSIAIGNLGTIDIIGGAGVDTVSTTTYTITDSLLGSLKSVEVLQTGSSYTKVTLGSAAQGAGIRSLIGGTGSDYTTVEQSFSNNLYYDGTASSTYEGIGFANQQQFANSTLIGNGWTNSDYGSGMEIAAGSTLSDYAFRNKSGLSDLYLNASEFAAHSEVTFSSYAASAGIKGVFADHGSMTVNQSTLVTGLYIDGSRDTRGGNLYNLEDFSLLEGHTLTPPAVTPATPPPTFVGQDTIYGAGLTDTLAVGGFSSGSAKYQPAFNNVHNVGVLSLTGGGTESGKYNETIGGAVLLDNSAEAAGIQTVYGSQDNSYILQTNYPTDSLNPAGWTNGLDIYGGRGNDLIGVFGFAGTLGNCTDDTFNTTAGMLANDVIDGGRGFNTLGLFTIVEDTVPPNVVTPANYRQYLPIGFADSSFTHVKNIQALAIGTSSTLEGTSVTLGGNAFNAGIQSVFGADHDTIYADWNEVGRNLTLDVSAYNGNGHDVLIGQQERGALGLENTFINIGLGNYVGFDSFQGAFQPQPTSNEFIFGSGYALGTSSVMGGLGYRDSLYINSNSSYHSIVSDNNFAAVGLVNNLVLNGNSSATLGNYASSAFGSYGTGSSKYGSLSGVHTVWGGANYDTLSGNTLGDTIIQASTWSSYHGLTVVGGHGNDSISIANSTLLAQDSIYGGFSLESADCVVTNHGKDTLEIGGGVTLNDSWGNGGSVKEIEALVLSCSTGGEGVGSQITLGSNFQSLGLDSIYGSDCNDTITILSTNTASNYINALQGNDLVTVDYGAAVGTLGGFNNNTLNGGANTDTLVVGVPATLGDSDFSNVSHFEALQLTATGGEGAGSAVTLGDTAQSAGFVSVYGSVAKDTITVTSGDTLVSYIDAGNGNDLVNVASLGQFSTINGGAGTDTLILSNTLSNNDSFGNVHSFEALQLTGTGGEGNSVTLGGSAQAAGFVSVYGSTGTDSITVTSGDTLVSYISAGDGNDFVSIASLGQFTTLDGGAGTDTLVISNTLSNNDSFGNVYSFEALQLTGTGGQGNSVTLGGSAQAAGFVSVFGSSGDDSITVTSGDTLVSYISAGDGNDFVSIVSLGQFTTLDGGAGTDTLVISDTLSNNDSFGNVYSFEALQLTGTGGDGNSVTLGGSAQAAGFVSIYGSTGDDSITVTSGDTLVSYISAGDGNDFVSIASLGQFTTLNGGAGTDTLVISNTLSNNDSFGNVYSFEALQLTGTGGEGNSVTLGGSAQAAGFVSVYGSTGDDSITVTSGDTLLSYINAGDGNDWVSVASLGQFTSVDGGVGGTDTLALGSTLSNNDSFGNVYNFNALQLTASGIYGTAVTLGSSADAAGFVSVYGSAGDDTITVTSGDTLLSYINAGDGNDLVSVSSLGQFSTIDGGLGGTDTLVLGSTLSNNDSFVNVINFNALQLTGSSAYGTAVTLGASADIAGFTSLYGSAGNDTITVTAGDTLLSYLNAADGNDLVSVASLGQFSTVDGGAGIDTISLGGVTLNDGNFGGTTVTNFEVIQVGCNTASTYAITNNIGSAVTLGANSATSGLSSLIGSDCNDTLTIEAGDTLATYLNANSGDDFVTVDFGGATTVSGGGGSVTPTHETLTASAAHAIAQSNVLTSYDGVTFSGVYLSSSYINSDTPGGGLSLGGSFGSPLTLESAQFTTTANGGDITYTLQGYDSLGGAILGDTLSFTGAEGTSTLVNFGTLFSGVYKVGISNGNVGNTFGLDSLVVDTLPAQGAVTLTGNNFTVQNGGINSGSSYGGLNLTGSSLYKTSQSGWYNHYINTSETIHSAFGGNFTLTSVDYKTNTLGSGHNWTLQGYDSLGNPISGETATLSASSTYALDTLGGAWTLGSSYVVLGNVSSVSGSYLYIDSLGYTLPTLGGTSTTLPAFNGSTLDGSLGTDTLHVGVGATLRDTDFINVHSFEALLLSGNNSSTNLVTLGSTAQTTGFSSVFAGTSASANVDASAYTNNIYITGTGSSYGLTFVGGSGSDTIIGGYGIADSLVGNGGDNLFQFSNAANLGNSTIIGAAGVDTLELTSKGDLNDVFLNDTLLNALVVTGGSNVTLAANAQNAGFTSVFISDTLGGSIYQEAGDTLSINFHGNTGNDLFYFDNATLLGRDTVTGNGGTDTITIGTSATLSDTQFTNVSGIDALSLTGGPNVVYFNPGADAQAAGISSIYGGSGSNFLTVNFTGASNIYLQGQNSSDTLVAGGGNDTLQAWSGTATTNSANDTYTGGAGSDYYVLGDTLGNAYGQSGKAPKASITDFNQNEDYLNVYNYGAGAADYTTQTLTGAYNLEILHGSDVVSQMYVQNLNRATFLTGGHVNYLS